MKAPRNELVERVSPDAERIAGQPLVSIMSFCKNGAGSIKRSIESVLTQSYKNIEFVVQDGASTDGTLEILRSYNDPRVKIVSEIDSGPAEAFWKVLNRCQGDIIATCLSDEELLPGAIERAVEFFRAEPHLGAITCDGFITDTDGTLTGEFNAGEFNIVDYLFGRYCPLWAGSFFRREALLEIGLKTHDWKIECLEFEIWCRMGTQHQVKYIPVRMAKYAVHATQLSNTKQFFHEHFDNRAILIRRMFSNDGFFGENDIFLGGCLYNQLYLLYNHVRAYELRDQMELLAKRMHDLVSGIDLTDRIRFMEYFSFVTGSLGTKKGATDGIDFFQRTSQSWISIALALPASFRQRIPRRVKRGLRLLFTTTAFVTYTLKKPSNEALGTLVKMWRKSKTSDDLFTPEFSPRVYHEVAQLYYARGQIDEALQLWHRAAALEDPLVDGLACQAMLMHPDATSADLATNQKRWADKHARPKTNLTPLKAENYDGKRPINIGYSCAFFDSYVFKSQLGEVLKRRNREKFRVFGYSTSPVPSDVEDLFDDFKVNGLISDERFVNTVRADSIDILVELTGFSPFNRFSAMASRCAPIQVSYLNHTGTCGVANVDFVLADDICVPIEDDALFTEQVYRLPGCFFCFNYEWENDPPDSPPAFEVNGFITFGTFASGGKINDDVIALWAKILRGVPNSKLMLGNHSLSSSCNREYMAARFQRHGIDAQQLILLGGADRKTTLSRYADLDISLDTWPYCGGNSVAEPIWHGVPVVTLKGDRFSSRYGASLVTAAGCPELVATSGEEYVAIAIRLAQSPDRLRRYRQNLRRMALEYGLSDAERFVRKLEAAYESMLSHRPLEDKGLVRSAPSEFEHT